MVDLIGFLGSEVNAAYWARNVVFGLQLMKMVQFPRHELLVVHLTDRNLVGMVRLRSHIDDRNMVK
jgi:hypothetical protein